MLSRLIVIWSISTHLPPLPSRPLSCMNHDLSNVFFWYKSPFSICLFANIDFSKAVLNIYSHSKSIMLLFVAPQYFVSLCQNLYLVKKTLGGKISSAYSRGEKFAFLSRDCHCCQDELTHHDMMYMQMTFSHTRYRENRLSTISSVKAVLHCCLGST